MGPTVKPVINRWGVLVLLCTLVVACDLGSASTPTVAPEPTLGAPPTQTAEPPATALPTDPSLTQTASPSLPVTVTPPTKLAEPTLSAGPGSWFGAGTRLLFVSGDHGQADLLALLDDGTIQLVFQDVGNEVAVSPDGQWLGHVRWRDDGSTTLELHDVVSGISRDIRPETTSGLFRFVFDPESRRLAYLDLGSYTAAGVPWALIIVDLGSGATARYDALMADPDAQPLPGAPVGWSGQISQRDELLIDTFLPYTEGGWMGLWGVALPADDASTSLDSLALRQLIPGAPVYSSRLHLAPDNQKVAFLGRDPNYVPDGYFSEFYDLAVNRIGLAQLDEGERSTLVEADDGSALAPALAWSPTGERLLFAQGRYEGENFADLTLKSTDLNGTVVTYGPLMLPVLGGLSDLAWCDASHAYYVTWDGGDGMNHLVGFDLNTGVSTEVGSGRRLELVDCAPR